MKNFSYEKNDKPQIKLLVKEDRDMLRNMRVFKETNKIWNEYKLNSQESVGNLMYLIRLSDAKSFEEWETFYLQSGLERQEIEKNWRNKNNKNINKFRLNAEYGRTIGQLIRKARQLADLTDIDLTFAFNFVYIRVIDETWIGYKRELKAINLLNKFNNVAVKNVDYRTDVTYAVDFEVFVKDKLAMAIQLKSTKYRDSGHYNYNIKSANISKNVMYKKLKKVDVIYLYIDSEKDVIVNMNEYDNAIINYLTQS